MSCRYNLLETQWAVSINIFPQNLNSMVTHTGQDRAQNISPTFTVTLECGDPAIGSQISQLLYIIWPWQSHFSSHDKKSYQYHPIRKYFNHAINNDDTKLFITSLFIIVDVLRRVNIEFRGWPWKTIWLLQNMIDKKSQQHFGYLSRKMF